MRAIGRRQLVKYLEDELVEVERNAWKFNEKVQKWMRDAVTR